MWQILWNGNAAHVKYGLTVEDLEHVLSAPASESVSNLPCCFGYTPEGVFIIVIYEVVDEMTLYPATAYEVK